RSDGTRYLETGLRPHVHVVLRAPHDDRRLPRRKVLWKPERDGERPVLVGFDPREAQLEVALDDREPQRCPRLGLVVLASKVEATSGCFDRRARFDGPRVAAD